jgi:protein-tyrosine phosphatase
MIGDLGEEKDWRINSAGTWAVEGNRAPEDLQIVLGKRGIDLTAHRSRIVDTTILETSDLILVMERGHKEALKIEYPDHARRIFLLGEMIGKETEIKDPIGGPLHKYESTAIEIEYILKEGYPRIKLLSHSARSSDIE